MQNPMTYILVEGVAGATRLLLVSTVLAKKVIQQYQDYLDSNEVLLQKIHTLRGKTLGCFCFPKPCHGDILAAYANSV